MKRYFINLRYKIESIQYENPHSLRIVFLKTIFSIYKFLIILTRGPEFSFPLVFQNQGIRSTTHSFKDFKNYQRKARIIFILIIILVLIAVYAY